MTIEIEQGYWKRVPAGTPKTISTGGMGPCMGIFIYNTRTTVTFACHFVQPHRGEEPLVRTMVNNGMREFGTNKIRIYVSGCVPGELESKLKRSFIEKLLTSQCANKKNINLTFLWPDRAFIAVEMTLKPRTGQFELFTSDTPF